MSARRIFGFTPSPLSAAEIAAAALRDERKPEEGVCLVITPNIDYVARLREDAAFLDACRQADIVTCDGWPVAAYARLRGCGSHRVTGYDIAASLMRAPDIAARHRLHFVIDSETTAEGIRAWAAQRNISEQITICVPPPRFIQDTMFCTMLAGQIREHRATILLMGVGSPQSELFIARHRAMLPPCWAFSLGQALKVEAGAIRRAPVALRHTGLEWAWRLMHEPRRLLRRYATASAGFVAAVRDDIRKPARCAR